MSVADACCGIIAALAETIALPGGSGNGTMIDRRSASPPNPGRLGGMPAGTASTARRCAMYSIATFGFPTPEAESSTGRRRHRLLSCALTRRSVFVHSSRSYFLSGVR